MKKLLLILLLSCVSLPVSGKPLSFHDLDWSMPAFRMSEVLERKNYQCKFEPYDDFDSVWNCTKSNGALVRIFEDQPLSSNTILFNCEAFNGCQHPFGVLVDAITERLNIEPTFNLQTLKYTWHGTEGDNLTFNRTPDGTLLFAISLNKGYYGEKLDF